MKIIIDGVLEDITERIKEFFDTFAGMDSGSDISVYGGMAGVTEESMQPAVIVKLNIKSFPFTTEEARAVAAIAERTLAKHPDAAGSMGLPDLIMALRYAADKTDQECGAGAKQ